MKLSHLVVLLVVNHRVPGEQKQCGACAVFAQDAQVLMFSMPKISTGACAGMEQRPQIRVAGEGTKPGRRKRAPGVQRLQQRVPDPFDALGVDQDARALFGGKLSSRNSVSVKGLAMMGMEGRRCGPIVGSRLRPERWLRRSSKTPAGLHATHRSAPRPVSPAMGLHGPHPCPAHSDKVAGAPARPPRGGGRLSARFARGRLARGLPRRPGLHHRVDNAAPGG